MKAASVAGSIFKLGNYSNSLEESLQGETKDGVTMTTGRRRLS